MSGIVSRASEMDNSYSTGGPMSLGRWMSNGRQSPTAPLKIFGLAKKKINDIFVEISRYLDESNKFIKGRLCYVGIAHAMNCQVSTPNLVYI